MWNLFCRAHASQLDKLMQLCSSVYQLLTYGLISSFEQPHYYKVKTLVAGGTWVFPIHVWENLSSACAEAHSQSGSEEVCGWYMPIMSTPASACML